MKSDVSKAMEEIISVFKNIKPNEMISLSPEAGKLLLDTIRKLGIGEKL